MRGKRSHAHTHKVAHTHTHKAAHTHTRKAAHTHTRQRRRSTCAPPARPRQPYNKPAAIISWLAKDRPSEDVSAAYICLYIYIY